MFKKLLNVGKGHSSSERSHHYHQQQQQQKNLFQLNEIRSYGFTHLHCLGYSATLSLLAVGSKTGLLRILGNPSVEFSYQLEAGNSIRQIEFIHCRDQSTTPSNNTKSKQQDGQQHQDQSPKSTAAKLVVLTDNGRLHLFELRDVRQLNFTDNTTQTDTLSNGADCCRSSQQQQPQQQQNSHVASQQAANESEYTKLEYVGHLDYFIFKLDDDDRSKRVTTLEISASGQVVYVGTEGGNVYHVLVDKFEPIDEKKKSSDEQQQQQLGNSLQRETGVRQILNDVKEVIDETDNKLKAAGVDEDETTAMNLSDEPQIDQRDVDEPFEMIKFEEDVAPQLGDEIKPKKQGAIESIKKHPTSDDKILLSYHRGLSIIYDVKDKQVDKYFYHNQILESSCFASGQPGDFFYTSHNDGSYIKWDTKKGTQSKADDDYIGQLFGPYPCKPTPKIQACTGLLNDQLEELVIFSGGMPRATYDDKNPVTIVRTGKDGKDSIKVVLESTSKVLDFVVITKPRGCLGTGAKMTTGGGGKKGKNKQQQQQKQQQQHNQQIAVALAIMAEEEFVVIDLLNNESYLEFPLPYLNCVQPSAITCNQHYSDVSDELYEQLMTFSKQQMGGKLSQNGWPIQGGKVIRAPTFDSHDILLTGHEDGSVNMWDVSDLSMRHLLHVPTGRFFSTEDDDLEPINDSMENKDDSTNQQDATSAWPPLKKVGRFDPYSDDTRLAIRKISLCPQTGTLLVAGTGGQVLLFELKTESSGLDTLVADEVSVVSDQRFTWKGREKLAAKPGPHKFVPGYQLVSYVQISPPAAATSTDLRSDWHLFAVGTSYGFFLYDYSNKQSVVNRCTLNVQDFAIVSGDLGAMSRKKSFRKSLRESFRRLRRGRSQRNQPVSASSPDSTATTSGGDQPSGPRKAFSRTTTAGVRTLNAPTNDTAQQAAAAHRNLLSGERQVEPKVELSSIVKCITLTSAVITNNLSLFKPSLWVGTNSGQVLVYAIDLSSDKEQSSSGDGTEASNGTAEQARQDNSNTTSSSDSTSKTEARLTKEIQLKHKAPIVAIFTSPQAPSANEQATSSNSAKAQVTGGESSKSTPEKGASGMFDRQNSSSTEQKSLTNESESNETSAADQQRATTPATDKSPSKSISSKDHHPQPQQQPRVLICSEEQFKVFNLPNLKPFCKFKLTAHEGLRAKKISITQFLKPAPTQNLGNTTTMAITSSSSVSKLQSTTTLNSSKSLQSFATQTSPSASPIPAASSSVDVANDEPQQANGAGNKSSSSVNSNKQTTESNNNSLLAPNNNKQQQDKELLNAKFGAKANSSSSAAIASTAAAAATTTTTTTDTKLDEQPVDGALFEPYMVCMSNQGDCAIYSVPDLKRQAQIQVCKREDVNGITSAMLTKYGEGYYLRSSSNFLRFSISSQRVLRVLSVV